MMVGLGRRVCLKNFRPQVFAPPSEKPFCRLVPYCQSSATTAFPHFPSQHLSLAASRRQAGAFSVRGFTLIEVMVVIAILGVLASMAAPSFRSIIERWQVKSTTESLVSSIYLARTEAMKRGGGVQLARGCDSGGWECGWVIRIPDPADASKFVTLRTIEAQHNVTVSRSPDASVITYNRSGQSDSLISRFTIQTKGSTSDAVSSICMSSAGQLRQTKESTCS